ncbi:CBF/Mak21 family-domain-containing protein [Zopfochytrium polystomum]|nr:CBF/Mak21 family-domain-containing protein [Zopfochytrium polystomum]
MKPLRSRKRRGGEELQDNTANALTSKRPKRDSSANSPHQDESNKHTVSEIVSLAREAVTRTSQLSNITKIAKYCSPESTAPREVCHSAMHALSTVFAKCLERGDFDILKTRRGAEEESSEQEPRNGSAPVEVNPMIAVAAWTKEQLIEFKKVLRARLQDADKALQVSALHSLLNVLRAESKSAMTSGGSWTIENMSYVSIIDTIVNSPAQSVDAVVETFVSHYLNEYDDLRLYFYRNVAKYLERVTSQSHMNTDRVYQILSKVRSVKKHDDKVTGKLWVSKSVTDGIKSRKLDRDTAIPPLVASNHTRAFSAAWLALLKCTLSTPVYRQILLVLHNQVIPFMDNPTRLSDFLVDSFKFGGSTSLLALNSLFYLIQNYNLDYPDFYENLYSLLTRDILRVKYRSRFFRLLDVFLSSRYIPAYLVAAFVKRLARLALLEATPSGIAMVLPMIYNLLRRHPSVIVLVHSDKECLHGMDDPFDFDELDPKKCRAIDSSLWEIQTLMSHFSPSISSLARIFSEPLVLPSYNIEDFLDHSYDYLLELVNSGKSRVTSSDWSSTDVVKVVTMASLPSGAPVPLF